MRYKDRIPGGMASGKSPSDFDPKALAAGIKVEMEHTTSRAVAREITMDHLTEDPRYYEKLARMEAKKSVPRALYPDVTPELAARMRANHRVFEANYAKAVEETRRDARKALYKAAGGPSGPFTGPKGGKYKDPGLKEPWSESTGQGKPQGEDGEKPQGEDGGDNTDAKGELGKLKAKHADLADQFEKLVDQAKRTPMQPKQIPDLLDSLLRTITGMGKSLLQKSPFVGPKGGLWEDAKHTIHWDPSKHAATKPTFAGAGEVKTADMAGVIEKLIKLTDEQLGELEAEIAKRKKGYADRDAPIPMDLMRWGRIVKQARAARPANAVVPVIASPEGKKPKPKRQPVTKPEQLGLFTIPADKPAKAVGAPSIMQALEAKPSFTKDELGAYAREILKGDPPTLARMVTKILTKPTNWKVGKDWKPSIWKGTILSHAGNYRALVTPGPEDDMTPEAPPVVPEVAPEPKAPDVVSEVLYAGGEGVESAAPLPGKILLTTDSDTGTLEEARITRKAGQFDQYTIWEWEWMSGPNTGKRESSYSHSWWQRKEVQQSHEPEAHAEVGPETAPTTADGGLAGNVVKQTKVGPKAAPKTPRKKRVAKPKLGSIEEVGTHVWGSRKDLAEIAKQVRAGTYELTGEDLEKLDFGDAAYLVSKQNLLEVPSVQTLRGLGQTPGAAHMTLAIMNAIGAKAPDTKAGRAQYASDIRLVVNTLLRAKTFKDIQDIHEEWRDLRLYKQKGVEVYNEMTHGDTKEAEQLAAKLREETGVNHVVYRAGSYVRVERKDPPPFEALGRRFSQFLDTFHKPGYMSFGGRGNGSKAIRIAQKNAVKLEAAGEEGWGMLDRSEGNTKKVKERGQTDRGWSFVKQVSDKLIRTGGQVDVKDADGHRVERTFSMPNIQYGNWMSQADREYHLKALEEALHDFGEVLGVDTSTIGLNGRLSVSMGGRGSGKAAAHYEPHKKIINLTKFSGAGTVAHEWGHALDNVIAEIGGIKSTSAGGTWLSNLEATGNVPDAVRDAIHGVMRAITKSPDPAKSRPAIEAWRRSLLKEANGKIAKHNELMIALKKHRRVPTSQADLEKKVGIALKNAAGYRAQYLAAKARTSGKKRLNQAEEKELRDLAWWEEDSRKRAKNLQAEGFTDAVEHAKKTESLEANIEILRLEGNRARKVYNDSKKIPPDASNYLLSAGMMDRPSYHGDPQELFARAFESHIEDSLRAAGRRNTYLVDGTQAMYDTPGRLPDGSRVQPYPQGAEREAITKALGALMQALKDTGELKKAMLRLFSIPLAKALHYQA